MKVDLVQISTLSAQDGRSNHIDFQKGEAVHAAVVAQNGNELTLRSQDGLLFKALMPREEQIPQGAQLEFIVAERSNGKLTLQLISISAAPREETQRIKGQAILEEMGIRNYAPANEALLALHRVSARPTKEMVVKIMGLMQEHGLTPKQAVFFALNGIQPSEENLKALAMLAQGETPGGIMQQIAAMAAEEYAVPRPLKEAALVQSETAKAKTAPHQGASGLKAQNLPSSGNQAASKPAGLPNGDALGSTKASEGFKAQDISQHSIALQNNEHTQSGFAKDDAVGAVWAEGEASKAIPPPVMAQGGETLEAIQLPVASEGAESEGLNARSISTRLLKMFMDIDEKFNGLNVKEAATEKHAEIISLKQSIQSSDIKGKALMSERMGEAISQLRLAQDINRFACVYIPIRHADYDAAELYIYKNKKRGKAVDHENTAILIALNTHNMGRVETLIKIEKRNISLLFRVEQESALPLFKESFTELYKLFKDINYNLTDTKAALLAWPTTAINAEEALTSVMRPRRAYMDYRI